MLMAATSAILVNSSKTKTEKLMATGKESVVHLFKMFADTTDSSELTIKDESGKLLTISREDGQLFFAF